jgi:hypothetical protein
MGVYSINKGNMMPIKYEETIGYSFGIKDQARCAHIYELITRLFLTSDSYYDAVMLLASLDELKDKNEKLFAVLIFGTFIERYSQNMRVKRRIDKMMEDDENYLEALEATNTKPEAQSDVSSKAGMYQ